MPGPVAGTMNPWTNLGSTSVELTCGAFDFVLCIVRLASTETAQPALMAVQPPILAIHHIVLDNLNKICYPLVCLLKLILASQPSHHLNPYPTIFLPTPTP